MFRNRVITFTTAVLFGASSYAIAQNPAPGSPQQPGQQQPPSTQQPPRPQTQTPSPSSTTSQSAANLQSPVRGTLVSVDTDEETFIITLEAGQAGAGGAAGAAQPGAAGRSGAAPSGAAGAGAAGAAGSTAQSGAQAGRGAMAANQVEFNYDDKTQVTGAEKGIAGLSAMKASRVTVHFVREGGEMKATRIEVQPAGAAAPSATPGSTAPGSPSTPGSPAPGSTQPRPQTNPNPDSPSPQPR